MRAYGKDGALEHVASHQRSSCRCSYGCRVECVRHRPEGAHEIRVQPARIDSMIAEGRCFATRGGFVGDAARSGGVDVTCCHEAHAVGDLPVAQAVGLSPSRSRSSGGSGRRRASPRRSGICEHRMGDAAWCASPQFVGSRRPAC